MKARRPWMQFWVFFIGVSYHGGIFLCVVTRQLMVNGGKSLAGREATGTTWSSLSTGIYKQD